jgi:beta-1,2-mannobiose phosphorylase / 1,2-beta-oligomannan phosphorylase
MVSVTRFDSNPILIPNRMNPWESEAVFNPCMVKGPDGIYHAVYRAFSSMGDHSGVMMQQSSIGYVNSTDGEHFQNRMQLIKPEFDWEKYGCEDPRIVCIDGTYYITYTALSTYPFSADGIKIAVAKTKDFIHFEKQPVTPFNSKAMVLFPQKINGKLAAFLTVHTDMPPVKVCYVEFEKEEDMWDVSFWKNWYKDIDSHSIDLLRGEDDHVEVGAPPVLTEDGWLLIYSHIENYHTDHKIFGIEALLLEKDAPWKILSRTEQPLMLPETNYERQGMVPNIVFPTGALIENEILYIAYGASDTTCCVASLAVPKLLHRLRLIADRPTRLIPDKRILMSRPDTNPILSPIPDHNWENKFVLNPASIFEGGKIHILYRAMGSDDTSVIGYASSTDGIHIDERFDQPMYVPRDEPELKKRPGNSGCEDPRLTKIGNRIYMTYTAYDAQSTTKVALTSISIDDFLNHEWNWTRSIIITDPRLNDKDVALFPEMIRGKYYFFHRLDPDMWIDAVDSLEFIKKPHLTGTIFMHPRKGKWDDIKIGISCPPIKTEKGWLLIYHGISSVDLKYRQGAMLLDLEYPDHILARLDQPILEPEQSYENSGLRPGTIFVCGSAVKDGILYLYYGGADQFTAVATVELTTLLNALS